MGEMRFGPGVCPKCGINHGPRTCEEYKRDNFDAAFRQYEKSEQMRDATPLETYRDIFNEITAKAIPFLTDPNDPGRILSYVIPCGPIHRAAGRVSQQMFNGEAHLAAAIARIAELEAELAKCKQ